MTVTPDDERVLEALVRASDLAFDANALAEASERRAPGRGGMGVARDPEAALLLRVFQRERSRARRLRWALGGLAACVLAGVAAWMLRGVTGPVAPSDAARLLAAAGVLRERVPEHFGSFTLVTEEELTAPAGVTRGGAVWVAPRGTVAEPPATLRWRRPSGSGRVEVTLRGPTLEWTGEIEGDEVAAPALGAGRYVVTLRALDDPAGQATRASFAVASEQELAVYARAREAWTREAPADLAPLLEAHYAFRHGWYARALEAARRAAGAPGGLADLARPLLRHLER